MCLPRDAMKRYDVIIIGSGIGGLTSGAMLSKEGLNVCVLEQHSIIGGCLQSFRRNGRLLDTGMHYVGSLDEGQIMHQYFKYLGIIDKLRLQKLDESGFDNFHFSDGTSYSHAMGYERFIDNLSSHFPEERNNIWAFCDTLQGIGRLIAPDVLRQGKIALSGFEQMSISAADVIDRAVGDERLKRVLAGNSSLYAGDRLTTSLYEYGMITHSNIEGAFTFVDGSQQVADLLAEQIRHNGGEVRVGAKVSKIVLDGNRVECVELADGERVEAKWVISSLHPSTTFSMLENNTVYKRAFFTRIHSLPNTYGLFTTYLMLKPNTLKYRPQNHYLFNSNDVWSVRGDYKGFNIPLVFLSMQPHAGSEYTSVVTLLTPMSMDMCTRWSDTSVGRRGEEYKEFKHRFGEAITDFACQYYPELRDCIDVVHTATPLTYRDYTSSPDGSAYGLIKDCRNPIVSLIPSRTRIANLLLAGQSLNVHGCIGTTASSAVACSEILGEEYLAKRIGEA